MIVLHHVSQMTTAKHPDDPRFIDLSRRKFNRLTVLSYAGKPYGGQAAWNCVCECGCKTVVRGGNLNNSSVKSCGCWRVENTRISKTIHGKSKTAEYGVWTHMKERCDPKNSERFPHYAGRGITVCARWLHSFNNFLTDMGKRPSHRHTIERQNNNAGYSPSNCVWATRLVQASNKRNNHFIEWRGKRQTISQWARELGVEKRRLNLRIVRYKWPLEKAMTQPPRIWPSQAKKDILFSK